MKTRYRSRNLKQYLDRVAALGCIVCRECGYGDDTPACLHHPRIEVGGAQRESDWLVIPLCPHHHDGAEGIHTLGDREFFRRFKMTELDIVALVIESLNA